MAVTRLDISPADFGRMGYGFLVLLRRELDLQDVKREFMVARIQATMCNLQRDPEKMPEPFSPWDFMTGWKLKDEDKDDAAPEVASIEDIARILGAKIG